MTSRFPGPGHAGSPDGVVLGVRAEELLDGLHRPGPARRAGRGEPRALVRAVAEGLDPGLAAPAERDRLPAGVDLTAVLVQQPEVPAHDQRAVPIGRDRGVLAVLIALTARR